MITIGTIDGQRQVQPVHIAGIWAVHRSLEGGGHGYDYTVTHTPSGMAASKCLRLDTATGMADALASTYPAATLSELTQPEPVFTGARALVCEYSGRHPIDEVTP